MSRLINIKVIPNAKRNNVFKENDRFKVYVTAPPVNGKANKAVIKVQINSYSFGSIEVQGKIYTTDLIVYPDRVKSNWWRKEGHYLTMEDLEEIIDYKPDILIVGKGASSCMKVPLSIKNKFKEHGIEVIDRDTDNACKLFNELIKKGKKVVGAFHLTC